MTQNHRDDVDDVGGTVTSEIGPWAMVPVWVLSKGLKPAELVTYVALRSFADRAGDAYPYTETIAKRANLARGTVRNAIQGLRAKGLIETTERYRADGSLAGLDYKLFDIDPNPGNEVKPRRTGVKPGKKPTSVGGTPTNAPPSTEGENTGAGYPDDVPPRTPTNAGASITWCTQEEHTIQHTNLEHQNPLADATAADDSTVDQQMTIDGGSEPVKKERTEAELIKGTAAATTRWWFEGWKTAGTPIPGETAEAKMRSLLGASLRAGYTEDELKEALRRYRTPSVPSADRLQRELAAVRGVGIPTARTGGRVNQHWNRPELVAAGATNGATDAPKAAAIQTEGAHW